MPIPLIPLIAAGGELLSQGINAVTQGAQNRKSRNFSREMYARQRADSLSDYAMQNQYNSPAEQMKRLRAAGLNPNLVYGNGATSPSATVRSSNVPSAEFKPAQFSGGDLVGKYLNAQNMQLQADNLKAQNAVLVEQAKNIATDTLQKKFGADLKEFDFNWKTDMRNLNEYALTQKNVNAYRQGNLLETQIANTQARTKTELTMLAPRVAQIKQQISESAQRVLSMAIGMAKSQAEIDRIVVETANAVKSGKI